MKVRRTQIAVGLDHDRLTAVWAVVSGDRVRVKGWHAAKLPEDLDRSDPEAVGQWVGAAFEGAGVPPGPVVLAVPRGEVVLKRLRLPGGEQTEADVTGMVRLQMVRQMTVGVEASAIDYIPMEADSARAGGEQTLSVLAGAIPAERLGWMRRAAGGARRRITRIGLRAAGVAAILAEASQRHAGPVLGIAPGWASTEIVVVEDGHLVFVRSIDTGVGSIETADDREGLAHRLSVEAKRTWMSYRVAQESAEVDAVVVLGSRQLSDEIRAACERALEMPSETVGINGRIELPEEMEEAERLEIAPLAGLLAEPMLGRPLLDFAHPRRAPDRHAGLRQGVLAAMLAAIVVGGGGYFFASGELSRLNGEVVATSARIDSLSKSYRTLVLDEARLGHVRAWMAGGEFDWLSHMRWLSGAMPDPREALLDSFKGQLETTVGFEPSARGELAGGRWVTRHGGRVTIKGSGGRDAANTLRGRLVDSSVYVLRNRGPDKEDGFEFELATVRADADSSPTRAQGGRP